MLYCCEDYKNVTRDNVFLRNKLFVWVSSPVSSFLKYKKFFKLGARNFDFPKYKKFLQSVFFFIFRARKVTSWNIRSFLGLPFPEIWESSISWNKMIFFFFFLGGGRRVDSRNPKHKKTFPLIKYRKFFNIRTRKFNFPKYKKI